MKRLSKFAILCAAGLLSGCGDNVPQSAAAIKAGEAPRQVVDKAAGDVADAMKQSAARSSEADQAK